MAVNNVSSQSLSALTSGTGKPTTSGAATSNASSATSTGGKTASVSAEESRSTFLRLLVAQLEHQDPLKPMENADFTAQLAQFSMLEQLEAMNTNLRSVVDAEQGLNDLQTKMQATSLIGKEVRIKGNTLQIQDGQSTQTIYKLAAPSTHVTVEIRDAIGRPVKVFEEVNVPAGEYFVPRDATDNWVQQLPKGKYTVQVNAKDGAGQPVAADMFIQGRVNGVEYDADKPYFLMGNNRVAFNDVVSIQN
jgi:flagellar basal-body rod modification protein FlgD